MPGNNGSATATILAIIMFLSIVFASIALLVNTGILATSNAKYRLEVKKRLITKCQEVLDLLYEDPNRVYDSRFGTVADYLASNAESVELKDIGSAFNPNIMHVELLEWLDPRLLPAPERLFKDPNNFNVNTIKQYWMDTGIHYDIATAYADYFEPDVIEAYFTPYTYFNINLTYEFVLERLFKDRTGSETDARKFHGGITALLQVKDFLMTNQILETWFTTNDNLIVPNVRGVSLWSKEFEQMFPVLSCEPQMNVHFVDETILRMLLAYEPFGIQDPLGKGNRLVELRDNPDQKGLTKGDLVNIIGLGLPYPGMRIYHYFGVHTNFWEIKAFEKSGEESRYVARWVIARIPKLKLTDDVTYKIIENSFYSEKIESPPPIPLETTDTGGL